MSSVLNYLISLYFTYEANAFAILVVAPYTWQIICNLFKSIPELPLSYSTCTYYVSLSLSDLACLQFFFKLPVHLHTCFPGAMLSAFLHILIKYSKEFLSNHKLRSSQILCPQRQILYIFGNVQLKLQPFPLLSCTRTISNCIWIRR